MDVIQFQFLIIIIIIRLMENKIFYNIKIVILIIKFRVIESVACMKFRVRLL